MDISDASYYIFNEKENKGSQMGHTKKTIKKEKKKDFWSPEQFCRQNFDHEIKSIQIY